MIRIFVAKRRTTSSDPVISLSQRPPYEDKQRYSGEKAETVLLERHILAAVLRR